MYFFVIMPIEAWAGVRVKYSCVKRYLTEKKGALIFPREISHHGKPRIEVEVYIPPAEEGSAPKMEFLGPLAPAVEQDGFVNDFDFTKFEYLGIKSADLCAYVTGECPRSVNVARCHCALPPANA